MQDSKAETARFIPVLALSSDWMVINQIVQSDDGFFVPFSTMDLLFSTLRLLKGELSFNMDDHASISATQEPKSALEKAIRNFIAVLSNAQSKVEGKTGATPVPSHPLAYLQASRERTQKEIQRSFPAMFQRQSRGKRPFPEPKPSIPAACNIAFGFCLLPASTTKTPQNEDGLLEAGLGSRRIGIAKDADHEQITSALLEKYPKMKTLTGGWRLYKAAGGKGERKLSVVAQGTQGYTAKMLRKATGNGKCRLYIVPLQEQIDTTPLPQDAAELNKMPKSQCKSCGLDMPLQLLVSHTDSCGLVSSEKKRRPNVDT